MRVAMLASECEPFAKTGGLADVVDALARALGRRGHEVDVYLPRYREVLPPAGAPERRTLAVPVGEPPGERLDAGDEAIVDLVTGLADGYRIRLVDHPFSYDRAGFYGDGGDYPDNAARFALLGRTMLEAIADEGRPLDVLHGHDWQAGPGLLLLRRRYGGRPAFVGTGALLTCHNLAYHGWLPRERAWQLGLGDLAVGDAAGVDLLREAIGAADLVNTVSPTYAEESRGPAYGAGVDDLLRALGERYRGIPNGLDIELWDAATDAALPAMYDAGNLAGKAVCKRDLLARHGLSGVGGEAGAPSVTGAGGWDERGAPLLGLVGRLDPQKGFDLLTAAAGSILDLGARLIVLGAGDAALVAGLKALAAERPDRCVVIDRFDRDEARRIYAGVDAFLMPSRFEPAGQGQLIALRYGTPPVVRATGGLADTIVDTDADPLRGNGFVFGPADPAALLAAVRRALAAYRDVPRWRALQRRGMAQDLSWGPSAARYVEAYEQAVALRRERAGG